MTAIVVRDIGSSHTAIMLSEGPKFTTFIPMASLAVERLDNRTFHDTWAEFEDYPVRRAAQLYLAEQFREITPQAREHLERIVADPVTAFDESRMFPNLQSTVTSKEIIMATSTKTAPAKTPATSKLAGKPATVPAKQVKPAAKTAPAAKQAAPAKVAPAAKTAPAKTPAKNGIATVVDQASKAAASKAPAKTPAKTAANKAATKPPVRPANDEKLKVVDATAPRRGETADYVAEAIKLKSFTRQQLHDVMVSKGKDSKAARIKIADCVYFKVFAAA